jgi:hypothetical protein
MRHNIKFAAWTRLVVAYRGMLAWPGGARRTAAARKVTGTMRLET